MNSATAWAETLLESLTELGASVGGFIPRLAGMLVILAVGYVVSRLAAAVVAGVLRKVGFDRVCEQVGAVNALRRGNIELAPSGIIGKLTFWFFMLTFLVSAADALGLENLSRTIDSFVAYVPNVIGAVGVAIGGLLVASLLREAVRKGSASVGVDYADALGTVVYAIIVVLTATLAVGQLRLETDLINRVIEIVLIAAGAGLALTLGLGTRDVVRNIVAGMYARDMYRPGMQLSVNGDAGALEEVGTVASRIKAPDGELVFIPNSDLMASVVRGRESSER